MTSVEFIAKTRALLKQEREAEILESHVVQSSRSVKELEQRGVCLTKLRLYGERTGLYGRHILAFEPWKKVHDPTAQLPANTISCGDIVGIHSGVGVDSGREQLASGVVTRCTGAAVEVAVEAQEHLTPIGGEDRVRLTKLANDVTHRRLMRYGASTLSTLLLSRSYIYAKDTSTRKIRTQTHTSNRIHTFISPTDRHAQSRRLLPTDTHPYFNYLKKLIMPLKGETFI